MGEIEKLGNEKEIGQKLKEWEFLYLLHIWKKKFFPANEVFVYNIISFQVKLDKNLYFNLQGL